MAIAREVGAVDVEMFALALNGLSLVSAGETEVGMRRIDAAAAAAVGGEMTDADSIESVCCFAIDACKRVRDLERANEWCLRVRDIAVRFGDRQMFAICRTHYADVLLWHGDWTRAEQELTAAAKELGAIRPGREVDALARLAELRRRQGRVRESEELLARVTSHRFHPLVEGLLALDGGDVATALEAAARFLRRIGEADLGCCLRQLHGRSGSCGAGCPRRRDDSNFVRLQKRAALVEGCRLCSRPRRRELLVSIGRLRFWLWSSARSRRPATGTAGHDGHVSRDASAGGNGEPVGDLRFSFALEL